METIEKKPAANSIDDGQFGWMWFYPSHGFCCFCKKAGPQPKARVLHEHPGDVGAAVPVATL